MNRISLFGVATAALALAAPVAAQDTADAERAFSRAARSFTACLAAAATSSLETTGQPETFRVEFARACGAQEAIYRQTAVRLRMSRGANEQQAASETDADVINGRLAFLADQKARYARAD